jgi:CubicO group peptidase (beta-lactamase class C family)
MRTLHVAIFLGLASLQTAPPAVDGRIARVETGLLPPIVWKGAARAGMPLSDRLAHYQVPGVSVAVVDGGAVAWARGWGVVRAGEAGGVTTDTLFQAGSVSKTVAALLTLRLASGGRLALDDPVNARLKSWRLPDSEAGGSRAVTIRHLLGHTAGLTPVIYEARDPESALPTVLDLLHGRGQPAVPPVTRIGPPGTRFSYSNSGFLVLQQLLVDLSGKPFDELATEELFVPLQMTSTTFAPVPASTLRARMAWGHDEQRIPIPSRGLAAPPAVGGLWATPFDLARLLGAFARSYRGERDGLLTPAIAREAMNVGPGEQGLLGAVEGTGAATRLIQMGSMPGFIAHLVCYPELGRGGVAMINAGGRSAPLALEVMRAVAREYDWPDYVREYERTELPPSALGAFVGEYAFADPKYPRIPVTSSDGRLRWAGREMVAVVGGTFVVPDASIEVMFVRDAAGTVVAADYGAPGMRKTRLARKNP